MTSSYQARKNELTEKQNELESTQIKMGGGFNKMATKLDCNAYTINNQKNLINKLQKVILDSMDENLINAAYEGEQIPVKYEAIKGEIDGEECFISVYGKKQGKRKPKFYLNYYIVNDGDNFELDMTKSGIEMFVYKHSTFSHKEHINIPVIGAKTLPVMPIVEKDEQPALDRLSVVNFRCFELLKEYNGCAMDWSDDAAVAIWNKDLGAAVLAVEATMKETVERHKIVMEEEAAYNPSKVQTLQEHQEQEAIKKEKAAVRKAEKDADKAKGIYTDAEVKRAVRKMKEVSKELKQYEGVDRDYAIEKVKRLNKDMEKVMKTINEMNADRVKEYSAAYDHERKVAEEELNLLFHTLEAEKAKKK